MKKCSKCKEQKGIEFFNIQKARKDGLSTFCKECNKENLRNHYLNNKKKYVEKNKIGKQKVRDYINSKKLKCVICNETHIACLDFHHKNSKEKLYNVSQMPTLNWSFKKIDEEIEKCILICSNCHRKIHWNEKNTSIV